MHASPPGASGTLRLPPCRAQQASVRRCRPRSTSCLSRLRRMRVLSVVGNRPQFIKSAPLSAALREAGIDETVVHTGQHYDRELSQVFFDELGLAEPVQLGLRTADPGQMRTQLADQV